MSAGCSKTRQGNPTVYLALIALAVLVVCWPAPAQAVVNHMCSHCHTMHNSQGDSPIDPDGPYPKLVNASCVGCHSNTVDGNTIVDGVPIVYNTSEPALPLAGGNFYWVATATGGSDDKGHNVYGISDQDSRFATAPGINGWQDVCMNNTCHKSLAFATGRTQFGNKQGCEGCHYKVSHHADHGWYRFLTSHGDFMSAPGELGGWVVGYEDPGWEQNPTPTAHNEYKGTAALYAWAPSPWPANNLETYQTINTYCGGCHGQFHSQTESDGLWLRHPSEVTMPGAGTEFASYTTYNPAVPVARLDAETRGAASGVVVPGTDIVMCLSCHRAHGSPYPHMLRWEYSATLDQGDTGCRTCHTAK